MTSDQRALFTDPATNRRKQPTIDPTRCPSYVLGQQCLKPPDHKARCRNPSGSWQRTERRHRSMSHHDKAVAALERLNDMVQVHADGQTRLGAREMAPAIATGVLAVTWAILDVADAIRNGSEYGQLKRQGTFGP